MVLSRDVPPVLGNCHVDQFWSSEVASLPIAKFPVSARQPKKGILLNAQNANAHRLYGLRAQDILHGVHRFLTQTTSVRVSSRLSRVCHHIPVTT